MRLQRVERSKIHCRADKESSPEEHADPFRNNSLQQIDRDAEQHHTEHGLDLRHPRCHPGEQLAARCPGNEHWRPHPHAQGEQRRTSEEGIAGLADVDERACQRCRHTGSHDEGREKSHDANTDERSALLAVT